MNTQPGSPKLPAHVAVIMDGNGRWAEKRNLPRIEGHRAGAEAVRRIMDSCRARGVRCLTLYAFSTENWSRPKTEVMGLMNLLVKFLNEYEPELRKNRVRLSVIGRAEDLPGPVQFALRRVAEATKDFDGYRLVLALSYGARDEITRAARQIAELALKGAIKPEDIREETVAQHLYTRDLPDPDLLIRTSGEMRLSNFMLWQLSYAELYVTDTLWPDFGLEDFDAALRAYAGRRRRFGGLDSGRSAKNS